MARSVRFGRCSSGSKPCSVRFDRCSLRSVVRSSRSVRRSSRIASRSPGIRRGSPREIPSAPEIVVDPRDQIATFAIGTSEGERGSEESRSRNAGSSGHVHGTRGPFRRKVGDEIPTRPFTVIRRACWPTTRRNRHDHQQTQQQVHRAAHRIHRGHREALHDAHQPSAQRRHRFHHGPRQRVPGSRRRRLEREGGGQETAGGGRSSERRRGRDETASQGVQELPARRLRGEPDGARRLRAGRSEEGDAHLGGAQRRGPEGQGDAQGAGDEGIEAEEGGEEGAGESAGGGSACCRAGTRRAGAFGCSDGHDAEVLSPHARRERTRTPDPV